MTHTLSTYLIAAIDTQRTARGFLSVTQLLDAASARDNVILDPFSTLVGHHVELGSGNTFYPNVVVEALSGGQITAGNGNVFYPGTLLLADGGVITIGDGNQFGPGGMTIRAGGAHAAVRIGSEGRYMNGADLTGPCELGSGTQVLGAIYAQNCRLEAGGSHQHPDPDLRGAVLKGCGRARNLIVKQGEVINGQGSFSQSEVERQTAYHPKLT